MDYVYGILMPFLKSLNHMNCWDFNRLIMLLAFWTLTARDYVTALSFKRRAKMSLYLFHVSFFSYKCTSTLWYWHHLANTEEWTLPFSCPTRQPCGYLDILIHIQISWLGMWSKSSGCYLGRNWQDDFTSFWVQKDSGRVEGKRFRSNTRKRK